MADYYPLLARAVTALERNTAETRRAMYARARASLMDQLHSLDPPLSESEILQERTALEQAIRKIEVESARRMPIEPLRSEEPIPTKPADPAKQDQAPAKGASLSSWLRREASAERPKAPPPSPPDVGERTKPQEGSWLSSILNKLNAQEPPPDKTAARHDPPDDEDEDDPYDDDDAVADRELPPASQIRLSRSETTAPAKPNVDKDNVTTLPIARQEKIRARQREAEATVLRSGTVEGLPFRLYTDGSIEAEFRRGWLRFDSVDDLRLFIRTRARKD
jgi:hypothetical protein